MYPFFSYIMWRSVVDNRLYIFDTLVLRLMVIRPVYMIDLYRRAPKGHFVLYCLRFYKAGDIQISSMKYHVSCNVENKQHWLWSR